MNACTDSRTCSLRTWKGRILNTLTHELMHSLTNLQPTNLEETHIKNTHARTHVLYGHTHPCIVAAYSTHSLTHSLTLSLTHSLAHARTHAHTRVRTHSLTHTLTHEQSTSGKYVAVRCKVLQCGAVCCSVLHCVAVCCSVLQYVAAHEPCTKAAANPMEL